MSIAYAAIGEAAVAAPEGANKIVSRTKTPPTRTTAAKADQTLSPEAL